jgi:transcriptional regulator with XRE-family HTH domain
VGDEVARGTAESWDDIPIGKVLAAIRKQSGLTGQDVAAAVEMSQSTYSRIETGARSATPEDVAKIVRALGAPEDTVRRLVARSQPPPKQGSTWRLKADDIPHRQLEIAEIEASAKVIRSFTPIVINGLLQTDQYARGILTTVHSFLAANELAPRDEAVTLSTSARIARQQVLANTNKKFQLVMPESVLWNRFCDPEDMLAQIRQIREIATQDNVSVGLIPIDAPWPFPAAQDFTVYDETCVLLDAPDTNILSRGSEDIATYRRLFDVLERRATTDISEILSTHAARYYKVAGSNYT